MSEYSLYPNVGRVTDEGEEALGVEMRGRGDEQWIWTADPVNVREIR